VAIKKSDLYSSLWKSCDELRGGMDASQYKDYILTLLFLKYVSDKSKADPDSVIEIPPGCAFEDIVELKGKKEIGERIDKIVGKLANANDLRGVIDVTSFNDPEKLGSGREMIERLSKLVAIFDALDFRDSRAGGDDLLGDAYEYLMRHFATESGKSKGQFYTPAEVSRVIANVVGIGPKARRNQTIYDPTCGSGSLLLKAADEAPRGLSIFGQEKDGATWALARMNMILHDNPEADLQKGDTITSPMFLKQGQLKTHDFVVANPPFSTKSWSSGISPEDDPYKRFELGVPPAKNGDYTFLLHALKSLKSTGKAAVIMPHGVLFRGGAEETIRRNLLRRGLIKGVIGLPTNLFYGTSIPACIVVIDKEGATERDSVFLLDASTGYIKDGAKNRLRPRDIHKMVDVFTNRIELERYSRAVPLEEIAEPNNYNLNLPRYIDSSEPGNRQDLDAHLNGGIPDHDLDLLSEYWEALPSLREQLFEPERPGYSRAKIGPDEVKATIEANPEFETFRQRVVETLADWWKAHRRLLNGVKQGIAPTPIIDELSEDLLSRFKDVPLLSSYDVYEQLMVYWGETMQDDVYLISTVGWLEAAKPRGIREIGKQQNGKPKYEIPDLAIGSGKSKQQHKMDLIPPELVIGRYFPEEKEAVEQLQREEARATQALDEYIADHGVEGGLLEDVLNEKGAITRKAVIEQLAALKDRTDRSDELDAAERCRLLLDEQAALKLKVKRLQEDIGTKTIAQYEKLNEAEIRALVVDEKWPRRLGDSLGLVVTNSIRHLIVRVHELDERYAQTLGSLERRSEELRAVVADHLTTMGWTEKKPDIQRGALQRLITGATRLPGFSDEWTQHKLGDVLKVRHGKSQKDVEVPDGRYPILATGGEIGRTDTPLYSKPSVLIGRKGTIDSPQYMDQPFWSVDTLFYTDVYGASAKYIFYVFQTIDWRSLNEASGVPSLSASRIEGLPVLLPAHDEQEAIAGVLSDMDAEIEALGARLVKARDIKRGMMQELLPDRTRLVPEAGAA
jgi:type I restriction enzyme M protein